MMQVCDIFFENESSLVWLGFTPMSIMGEDLVSCLDGGVSLDMTAGSEDTVQDWSELENPSILVGSSVLNDSTGILHKSEC